MTLTLGELSSLVSRQYTKALSSSTLIFYPSVSVQTKSSHDVSWHIRLVPSLLDKANAKPKTITNSDSNNSCTPALDVFAPPYPPDLFVTSLDKHAVLLNKFCLVPEHFLLVTNQFESQERPPAPDTIALSYSILKHSKKDLLAFYNCGKHSGASQPHRHVQFIPLESTVPIETLLDRVEKDGHEMEHVHALPVPWQHFTVLLNGSEDEAYLAHRFTALLDCMFRARMVADQTETTTTNGPGTGTGTGLGAPSFNILISRRAMHLIPRRCETFDLASGISLSINSLGYAGFLLTKSEQEQSALANLEGGVPAILAATGVPPVQDTSVANGLPTSN